MRWFAFVLAFLVVFIAQAIFAEVSFAQTLSNERLVFRTNVGDVVVALYPKQAPATVQQIVKLARLGVFDGVKFFRVEPGFVAQIENFDSRETPLTSEQQAAIIRLPLEVNSVHHRRGILSMARYDDPNSAEASFSFVLGEAPHLDGQYTAFGEVISGLDVLSEMEKSPTIVAATAPAAAKPHTIEILHVDVVDASELAKTSVAPARAWAPADDLELKVFLVFAVCAFSFTVLKPMVTTLRETKKAA